MSQTPERSGCPSAVLGAGAFMSIFPSAPVGAPGATYFGHCAISVVDAVSTEIKTASFQSIRT